MADAEEQVPLKGGTAVYPSFAGGVGRYRQSEKSRMNLWFVLGIVLCIIAIIIFIMLIIAWFTRQGCATEECVIAAAAIMAPMNLSADPCDDFYNYACGEWHNVIPSTGVKYWDPKNAAARRVYNDLYQIIREPDATLYGKESSAVRKSKDFFAACMDEDAIDKRGNDPLERTIKELGSWALTSSTESGVFDAGRWSLEEALGVAHQQTQGPIFLLTTNSDGASYTLQPRWHTHPHLVRFKDYYDTAKGKEVQLIARVAKLLQSPSSEKMLEETADKILELHKNLSMVIEMDCLYQRESMNLSQFQSIMGDWFYVEDYWMALRGEEWNPADRVNVICPDYFRRLGSVLETNSVTPEMKSNAVVWSVVKSLIQTMGEEYRLAYQKHIEFGFGDDLVQAQYRWEECLQQTMEAMPAAVYALYIDKQYDPDSTSEVRRMSDAVIDTYLDHVYYADWMDEVARQTETNKIYGMPRLIGYPPAIVDRAKLDAEYDDFNVTSDNFENHKLMTKATTARGMSGKYSTTPKAELRDYHSLQDYIKIMYLSNDFHVPAGIMQRVFYSADYPDASNYGGLGAEIGRVLAEDVRDMVRHSKKKVSWLDQWRDDNDTSTDGGAREKKDCGYEGVTRHQCEQKGCVWEEVGPIDGHVPWCFLKREGSDESTTKAAGGTTTPKTGPSRGDRSIPSQSRRRRDAGPTKKDDLEACLEKQYDDSSSVSKETKAERYEELFHEGVALQVAYEAYGWKARRWDNARLAGLDLGDDQVFFVGYAQGICQYLNPLHTLFDRELSAKKKKVPTATLR